MSNNTADKIYSYHTFLLAFRYERKKKQFMGNWEKDDLLNFQKMKDDKEIKLNYQRIQYFTPEARELLFRNGKYYNYKLNSDEQYSIEKDGAEYNLDVNAVRAILFEGNIGILILELENTKYTSIAQVKHINEYGRRINLPYIGDGTYHALVANKITFLGKTEDFVQKGKEILKSPDADEIKDGYIMKPLRRIINLLLGFDENDKNNKIVPVIDDRMFVCCMVRDEDFSQEVKSIKEVEKKDEKGEPVKNANGEIEKVEVEKEGKGIYLDRELSKKIYSFSFIDADGASCQSVEMREEILKRCIDPRWRDYGTIDVITHHSLVRITGGLPVYKSTDGVDEDNKKEIDAKNKKTEGIEKGLVASAVNPFLIQYVYLAIGALVQRATILSLSAESAEISEEYSNDGFSGELDKKLRKLKKKYVYAQNNIFLHELTVQEQGIEEFDMLKNELYINDNLENLNSKIDGLYGFVKEYNDDKEERKFNIMSIFLALMFIFEPLSIIIANNSDGNIIQAKWWAGIPIAFIAIVVLVWGGLYLFNFIRRKCRQKMRKTRR